MSDDYAQLKEVAERAARKGAAAAMQYFRSADLQVDTKSDDSPVTLADRAAEAAILAEIKAAFPAHAILSEESGEHAGDPRRRWIVDPLDGTRGFTRGGSTWGPLVAHEVDGQVVAGAMMMPVAGTLYVAARGLGCFRDGVRVTLPPCESWSRAVLSMGELHKLTREPWREPALALASTAASTRAFGDVAAVAMMLDGLADAWLEAGVQSWDLAPYQVLLAEAGATYTDLTGAQTVHTGHAMAATPALHAHMLAAFKR
jgi:histidinol-phosphatase